MTNHKRHDTLHLPLKAKWYEMIESGEKKEEYREIKQYWCQRIQLCPCPKKFYLGSLDAGHHIGRPYCNITNSRCIVNQKIYANLYKFVQFSYGYTRRCMLFEIKDITIGIGKHEWGAPEDKEVFIIRLGERILN